MERHIYTYIYLLLVLEWSYNNKAQEMTRRRVVAAIYDFLGQAQISSETGQTTWIPFIIYSWEKERENKKNERERESKRHFETFLEAAEEREQMPVKGNEERDSFGNRVSGMCRLTRDLCQQFFRGISFLHMRCEFVRRMIKKSERIELQFVSYQEKKILTIKIVTEKKIKNMISMINKIQKEANHENRLKMIMHRKRTKRIWWPKI